LGTNKTQVASGQTTLNNTNNQIYGIISSLKISGNSSLLTNGLYLTPILLSPVMTNAVNNGDPFSSPNTNGNSGEQFGRFSSALGASSTALGLAATSSGDISIAIGSSALASNSQSIAIGAGAVSGGQDSTAIGSASVASADRSVALGEGSTASGTNSIALGFQATSTFSNSAAIGVGSATTAAFQVMLGAPGISTVIQNNLTVKTNETVGGNLAVLGLTTNQTWTGTNNFGQGSDIAFSRFPVTSLANGNNAAVPIGTNIFIEVSGPSADFTINGIAGGRDGKYAIIVNQTGFNMTVAHQSGTDPTAANRIISMTGADRVTTANGSATLIYSGAASRWLLIAFDP